MYDTVAESVFVEKLETAARVGRQRGVAPAEDDWPDEQLELVDQPGHESLCCKVRAANEEIRTGGGLEVDAQISLAITAPPSPSNRPAVQRAGAARGR